MHFPKILICTDFSDASTSSFELAAYEEKMEGSEITLLNVYHVYEPGCLKKAPTSSIDDSDKEYRNDILIELEKLAKKNFHNQNVNCEAIITRKNTADVICEYAESNGMNLVVVGSRGHTPLGALFLGSVAQRILQVSKVPVLVIPPEATQKS